MLNQLAVEIQRLYPQIYLACHVDHVRSVSTKWRLSSQDSSLLAHLDKNHATSPRVLARHLGVAPSTLSATIARLEQLGYLTNTAARRDKRQRCLHLTTLGAEAMSATSVLDRARVRRLLQELSLPERDLAVEGMRLLARAARASKRRR